MARIEYPASSPYGKTGQTTFSVGRYVHRRILPKNTDTLITIETQYHNRPDRLSQDLYGTPAYWWVFMCRNMNKLRDPIWDLKAGMQIYVPAADDVRYNIG